MDRAEAHNALSPRLIEDLKTAFSDVHQEKRVRAVVLTGAGENFCAGTDLKVLSAISEKPALESMSEWITIWQHHAELYEQMLRFPKPIIAAVDGA
ncbi:MAG: enoyl-CoA hydratase/isomerase family protein, partial [Pirellulales bacterium]|nr:enoyl-CoA hydratase/isomerase family protein [Pirellulales bacterium]